MITVGVDIGPLLETLWTGIPVYTARLCRLLIDDPAIRPVFMISGTPIKTTHVVEALEAMTGLYLRSDYQNRRCVADDNSKRIDKVLFPTVKGWCRIARSEASVVHDLTTIITPEYHTSENVAFHRSSLAKEIASNEVTFVTSEATASDICYYFDVPRSKVQVAYQFVDWPPEFAIAFESRYPIDATLPYILVVGTIEPRKNLRLVLTALEEMLQIDHNLSIIIMGKAGWRLEEAVGPGVTDLISKKKVQFSGFVDEFKKYCLLRLCRFTVFPSLMEGFGIPVLESLDLGKPVLASWSSSIPEVGREAVMYFDPLSKADFIRGVRRLYEATSDPRSALSHTAERVASRFTPESFYQPFRSWILG